MSRYHLASGEPVEWYATKYDECTVHATGHAYRMQEGSGRSEVISKFFKDGMKLGDISREAAQHGWDSAFVVDCAFKVAGAKQNAWEVHPPEGTTIEAIKSQRKERELSPEQAARRAEREAEKERKKAERTAAKEAAAAERERKKAEAQEAKRREREVARRALEEQKAAAAAAAGGEGAEVKVKAKSKGKGKGKTEGTDAPAPTPDELAAAAQE